MDRLQLARTLRRRDFLSSAAGGIGMAALAHLIAEDGRGADPVVVNPFEPKKPHFPGKAKNIIFLYMEGAPSQIDLLDPKPALDEMARPASASIDDEGSEIRFHQA